MRGLFTSGVLDYLLEKDMEFKKIYAVSAGTSNACNFVSKQKGRAYKINTKYRGDKHFASMYSLITTGDYFGKKFQLDTIPNQLNLYDYDAFMRSESEFYAVATNCETGKPEYLKVEKFPRDMEKIWASSSLPMLARMVEIEGKKYLDGGVADSIPIIKSLRDGNKKNVIVLTRDVSYRKEANEMMGIIKMAYRHYPNLVRAVERRHLVYNKTLDFIEKHEQAGHLFVIRPEKQVQIDRLEKNQKKLKALYKEGYRVAENKYEELIKYLNR